MKAKPKSIIAHIPQTEPWFAKEEALAVFEYMQKGGWVTEHNKTTELENMITQYFDAKYCLMTTNGTTALILALLALEIKPQDEVLVPNITMIATANSCVLLGIKPVLVDVTSENLCLDIAKAKSALTNKTKALIYVPLNGRSGNMSEIVNFCKKNRLFLIEDAAQAFGSHWRKKQLGTFGKIGTFSFSIHKVISTGQGGALITNNRNLLNKLKMLKNFGRIYEGGDIHNYLGWNFRFTDLQAVIGLEQLKKLPEFIRRKKEIFKRYLYGLQHVKEVKFINTDLVETCPMFVDIYIEEPDKLAAFLTKKGIGSRRLYPPLHTQKIYASQNKGNFPISERFSSRGLWLPSSTKLTNEKVDLVIKSIRNFYHA